MVNHSSARGSGPPNHQALMVATRAHLDAPAVAKRSQAVKSSTPKMPKGFGALGGSDPMQAGLLSSGSNESDVPSGDAMGTTRSPLQQRTSGGRSQVPNSNTSFNRGPYDDNY